MIPASSRCFFFYANKSNLVLGTCCSNLAILSGQTIRSTEFNLEDRISNRLLSSRLAAASAQPQSDGAPLVPW